MRRMIGPAVALVLVIVMPRVPRTALGAGDEPTVVFSEREIARIRQHSPLGDPPPDPTNKYADEPAAARLGQFLFFEKGFSGNGEVACATCHDPKLGFGDGKPVADTIAPITKNSPTLWNVAYNRWFFHDGRADTLWLQALKPIEHPLEMGGSRLRCAHIVYDNSLTRQAYERIFGPLPNLSDAKRFPSDGRPVDDNADHPHHVAWMAMAPDDRAAINRFYANICKAIAAYERLIVSRNAPFDAFVAGLTDKDPKKLSALSASARRGLRIFVGKGACRTCHSGPNFSDGEFHNNGTPPLGGGEPTDPGRYDGIPKIKNDPFNAAGVYSDRRSGPTADKVKFLTRTTQNWGQFKTPTLRNVARTAPYMRMGQFKTLTEVVHFYSTMENAVRMGHHKNETTLAPLNLTERESADLIAFLESLTDERINPDLLRAPVSPLRAGAAAKKPR